METEIVKLRLKADHHSTCDPHIIYGRKGDEVTLISVFDNVCIVADEAGKRFPANIELLSGNIIPKNQEAAPGTAAPNKPIINRAPVPKKKKEVPINQSTLF
jgi:hypothetical protein